MSLLNDARQRREMASGASAYAKAAPGLPDLANHLAALDAELLDSPFAAGHRSPTPTPTAASPAQPQDSRSSHADANGSRPATQPARRSLWLAVGTLSLILLAIGSYLAFRDTATEPAAITPPLPATTTDITATSPATAPASLPAIDFARPATSTAAVKHATVATPIAAPRQAGSEPTPDNPPIHLKRSQPHRDPVMEQAEASLQRGDIGRARDLFSQMLQRDPLQTDALLAMAAIAQHQGDPALATDLRQRALIADPGNPVVQAALLGSQSATSDRQARESRLKTLLAAHPDSAPLNFALGNLYAEQRHWAEAQQRYFAAVTAAPDNPDYLGNLAISLDQLRQPRLAAQYYAQALTAAEQRQAAFDRTQLQQRLHELQP